MRNRISRLLFWVHRIALFPAILASPTSAPAQQPFQPGLLIRILPDPLLSESQIDDFFRDCKQIGNRKIAVHQRVSGTLSLAPVPSSGSAMLRLSFRGVGQGHSRTVVKGRQVYADDFARLFVEQYLVVDANGIRGLEVHASANAQHRLQTTTTRRGPVRDGLTRLAVRSAYTVGRNVIDRQASLETCMALRDEFRIQGINRLAEINRGLQRFTVADDGKTEPLFDPAKFHFASTHHDVEIRYGHVNQAAVAPALGGEPISLRVHESVLNQQCQTRLGGATISVEQLEQARYNLSQLIPTPELVPDEEQTWSITFAEREPLEIDFAGDSVVIQLNLEKYYSENRTIPAMNVSARYNLRQQDDKWIAVRTGKLRVLAGSVRPVQRLGARQMAARTILQRRFARLFPEELALSEFNLVNFGQTELPFVPPVLSVRSIGVTDGWLSLGLVPQKQDQCLR